MSVPEKQDVDIGFVPLTDSAPLIMAKELGYFEKFGLNVRLRKQNSWATLRDKLHAGVIDAAQMLAPMPLASSLGLSVIAKDVITPMVLSLNGNAITLSEKLYFEVLQANKLSRLTLPMAAYLLQEVVKRRAEKGQEKLRFANVFPYSCHNYQLRDWLKSGSLAEEDVDIVIVPPVNMVHFLESGEIDGFCVGGPWNAKAVRGGIGITALTSYDIWQDSPEKVLGVLGEFNEQSPNTVLAICAALKQACDWLEHVPNRFEAARTMCSLEYLDANLDVIAPSLLGSCLTHHDMSPRAISGYNQFSISSSHAINQPALVRGEWLLKQMSQAGQLENVEVPQNIVSRVFRPDIYRKIETLIEQSHQDHAQIRAL